MKVSPRCLHPLHDAKGDRILVGMLLELRPGTRPYRRLHQVKAHRAGFLMFVRQDGGYVYHAQKNRSKTGYRSKGRFPSKIWHIV